MPRGHNISLRNQFPVLFQNIHGGEAIYDPVDPDNDTTRLLWLENVLPTPEGLCASLRSDFINSTFSISKKDHTRAHLVLDGNGAVTFYFHGGNSRHVVYNVSGTAWSDLGSGGSEAFPGTIATLLGQSYVHDVNNGLQKFDSGFASLSSVTVNGLTTTAVNGFTNALDYAIAWDDNTVYWSAPQDITEFSPLSGEVATGAGSSRIREIDVGKIITCAPIANGFLIYTSHNIVSARYSGNSVNPWVFREVENGAGILFQDAVNIAPSARAHFVWTREGLRVVTLDRAENVFPQLNDFLQGYSYFSSDGDGTFTLNTSTYTDADVTTQKASLAVRISYIGNRYVCISYGDFGEDHFSYFLVFDSSLEMWGHVKLDHVDVFSFYDIINHSAGTNIFDFVGEIGQGIIGVLRDDGQVDQIKPITTSVTPDSGSFMAAELVLGEVRGTRNHDCQLTEVILHGFKSSSTAVNVLTTLTDGQQTTETAFTKATDDTSRFLEDIIGRSHRIRVSGAFNLSGVEILYNNMNFSLG